MALMDGDGDQEFKLIAIVLVTQWPDQLVCYSENKVTFQFQSLLLLDSLEDIRLLSNYARSLQLIRLSGKVWKVFTVICKKLLLNA